MAVARCPGQDTRFWKPDDIFESPCPHCGASLEFWKDEPQRKCRGCGQFVRNPKINLGCAEWCRYAKECLGVSVLPTQDVSLCDDLVAEMKEVCGGDERRVAHALTVLKNAEQLLETENGDPLVVKAAAILYDVGNDEPGGADIVQQTLEKLGVDQERVDHLCRIIAACHGGGEVDTPEFQIVSDAVQIADLSVESGPTAAEQPLLTKAGRGLVEQHVGSG